MNFIFETDRLLIRPWNPPIDAEPAFAIYGDAEVMHFIPPTATSVAEVRTSMERNVARYAELNNGTGTWAIVDKTLKEIVGAVLLKQLPDNQNNPTQDYEVGWHLRKAAWGKGYATEAGWIALKYGFEILKLPVIYAVVNPENHASIRVTQRLKMKPMGRVDRYYGLELELFRLYQNEMSVSLD